MSSPYFRVAALCAAASAVLSLAAPEAQARRASQISAGGDTNCAVIDDGQVACWGSNSHGQLGAGLGTGANASTWSPQLVQMEGGIVLSGVRKVVVGTGAESPSLPPHACAITDGGQLWCWGPNTHGQLGVHGGDRSRAVRARPGAGAALAGVQDVALGAGFTCALVAASPQPGDNRVHCWGRNVYSQAGTDPSDTPIDSPTTVLAAAGGQPLTNIRSIDAGYAHTCVLRNDGHVLCWGDNQRGQLGDHSNAASKGRAVFAGHYPDAPLADASELVADGWHSCARAPQSDDGSVLGIHCWGRNDSGQTGTDIDDAEVDMVRPVLGANGVPFHHAGIPAAGNYHACARFGDLEELNWLYCWGSNSRGQIGRMSPVGTPNRYAVEVPPDVAGSPHLFYTGIRQLAAGDAHTCALDTARRVRCWGRNNRGQLGVYDNDGDVAHPVPFAHDVVFTLDGKPADPDEVFIDGLESDG